MSEKEAEGVEELETDLVAAQARVTELEQRLRLIQRSRTYKAASRMWRIRGRMRALFFRRRPKGSGEKAQTAAEATETLPWDQAPYAAGNAEVIEQTPIDAHGSETQHTQDGHPNVYYGSRAVRATAKEEIGPLHAVLLLGGLTQPELEAALRDLAADDRADGEPLVITDCDGLKTLDDAGYLYEYIPPRKDWERRLGRNGDDYDSFVQRRLASIAGMYGVALPSTS